MTQNDPNKIENSAGYDKKEQQRAKRRGWFWLLLLIILLAILFGWHNYKNTGINPINSQQNTDTQLNNTAGGEPNSEAAKNDNAAANLNQSATADKATSSDQTPDSEKSAPANQSAATESDTNTDPAPADSRAANDEANNQNSDAATSNGDSSTPPAASSDTDQTANANQSEPAPTVITTESQAALAKLDTYFKNDSNNDSEWIDLDDVSFAVGSAVPEFDSEKLKRVAELLASHSDKHFLIHGFTDSTGPADLNKNLSTERANKISQFLIENGVKSEQVSVEGQGAKSAVADNDTKDGRDKNRRVAIKVLAAK